MGERKRRLLRRPVAKVLVGLFVLGGASALTTGPVVSAPAMAAPQLVMFESANCEWCAAWDREVGVIYRKTAEGRLAPLRRVDLHGPRPADLQSIGTVVYTPTFVLLVEGKEVGRITGYPGDDHFWGLLDGLLRRIEARRDGQQHRKEAES